MALAMMVGLVGGIGLAFLVEYLDNSIKTTEELERVVRAPRPGSGAHVIPQWQRLSVLCQSVGLATYEKPKSPMGDAIEPCEYRSHAVAVGKAPGRHHGNQPERGGWEEQHFH